MQATVVLIFQPAEERGVGAYDMIQEQVLEGVGAIFGLHLVTQYPLGVVASRPGEFLAGCGSFKAKIKGKGGLAGIPHYCLDPVLAASTSVISLQNIVSREADPLDSQVKNYARRKFSHNNSYDRLCLWFECSTKLYTESLIWQVLSVAMVHAGSAHDTVPDCATFGGTYRAFSKKSFHALRKRIEEVVVLSGYVSSTLLLSHWHVLFLVVNVHLALKVRLSKENSVVTLGLNVLL